jgi:hypothetical protein
MVNKLKVKLQDTENRYVKVKVTDRFGKDKYIQMHGYLIGMEAAFQLKKEHKLHNLVIVTGSVGSGKSSLVQGVGGINAVWNKMNLGFDNISWSTEKFIEKTDREDNIGTPQWWDESIQGAGGRNMAITSMGNKLKMAFVTKRFKKHTYYLVVDEINEYAWKLIKMSDAWINVRRFGLRRGYFDVYTNKKKIKFIYNAFKYYNATWESKQVRNINADCKGKFENYEGLFLDEDEYNRLKLEETKQLESVDGVQWKKEKAQVFYYWAKGHKYREIEDYTGVKEGTIKGWAKDFKKVVGLQT